MLQIDAQGRVTGSDSIFTIRKETKNRITYWVINGAEYYPVKRFTLEQAIKDYESEEAQQKRFDADYRAYCD